MTSSSPAPAGNGTALPQPVSSSTNPNPSEVGWQFVPQYYTFVNKHPNRLHCFYTKASTFIHGTEGEDLTAAHGQQEIHNKITAIGFQDCKTFIDCVDAQASSNGGIVVQVIGEMSNRGEPWRKFVQTFFLAEQPGGYFVLNDIFRFLKEEAVEEDATAGPEPVPEESHAAPAPHAAITPAPAEVAPAPVETTPSAQEPAPAVPAESEQHVNGVSEPAPVEPEPEPAAAEPEPEFEPEPEPAPVAQPEPAPEAPAPAPAAAAPQQQPTPAATPAAAPSPAPGAPSPAAAPTPPAAAPPFAQPAPIPALPKTWANLAAANSKKWGAAVATESKGTSEAPPQSTTPAPRSATGTPAPGQGPGRGPQTPRGDKESNPLYQAVQALTTPQCFVKGVIENVSQPQLSQVLTARFGPIKELEIVRSKACAFLEFNTLDAAKRAIAASLPMHAGGEGGIRIDCGDGIQARITVETRKERGDRPVSRPHRGGGPGGAPGGGQDRGGFRGGRGGGNPRGRGGPPPAK